MKSKLKYMIIIAVLATGCTSSLKDTKWLSIDTDDSGDIIMEKEAIFYDSKYILINKSLFYEEADTITGNYKYSENKLYLSYDKNNLTDSALVRNDSIILGKGNEGYLVFKKQK